MSIKHTILDKNGYEVTKNLTPIKAIRENCYNCAGFNYAEVKRCGIKTCPLYPFRMGKTGTKRNLSDEQKKVLSDRMKKLHSKKA